MDIEHLRLVATAARTGSFTQAARELNVSPSTFTRGIQRVETELGCELFDRSGRQVALSALGQKLLPHIERTVQEADTLARLAREAANSERYLDIASCAPGPMWALVPQIAAQYPHVQLLTKIGVPDDQLIEDLRDGIHDLVIISSEPPQECTSEPFMVEQLSVSLPHDHPLAHKEQVSFAQLDGETFLIQNHTGYWSDVVRRKLPHSTFQTQDDYVLMAKIMGESPLPHFATDMSFEGVRHADGRVLIPISDDDARVRYHLACLERRRHEMAPYLEMAQRMR